MPDVPSERQPPSIQAGPERQPQSAESPPATPAELQERIKKLEEEIQKNSETLRKHVFIYSEQVAKLLGQVTQLPDGQAGPLRQRLLSLRQRLAKVMPSVTGTVPVNLLAAQQRDRLSKEGMAVASRYSYSPERFESREAYMQFLANHLRSVADINTFLRYMYRYTQAHDRGHMQNHVNTSANPDRWLQPTHFVTEYASDGRFTGDCEDIAFLFCDILSRQRKQPFCFKISGHALTGWFEQQGGTITANVVDTTGPSNLKSAQA